MHAGFTTINRVFFEPRTQAGYIVRQVFVGAEHQCRAIVRRPGDAAKTDPGVCGCGVADVDMDGDGLLDCSDTCPNDPAKPAPGICGCGTPDLDTDGVGTLDCNDAYPSDPNKTEAG